MVVIISNSVWDKIDEYARATSSPQNWATRCCTGKATSRTCSEGNAKGDICEYNIATNRFSILHAPRCITPNQANYHNFLKSPTISTRFDWRFQILGCHGRTGGCLPHNLCCLHPMPMGWEMVRHPFLVFIGIRGCLPGFTAKYHGRHIALKNIFVPSEGIIEDECPTSFTIKSCSNVSIQ